MWIQSSGYYTLSQLFQSKPVEPKENYGSSTNSKDQIEFLNCGGTIVSIPHCKGPGVLPTSLIGRPELQVLKNNNIGYKDTILKLSQDFGLEDYKIVEKVISQSKDKLILCHGTDYIATFAVFADLMAKKYKKKILVLVSQRSLDKPTSDLVPLVSLSPTILSKVKGHHALVATRLLDGSIELHSPYEIRKYATYAKDCFYSEHKVKYNPEKLFLINTLGTKILHSMEPLSIEFEHFFHQGKGDLVIGSGIGNKRSSSGKWIYSRCLKGPINHLIYHKDFKPLLHPVSRNISSWQSLLAYSYFNKWL